MPRFKVVLARTFLITVEAADREDAKQAADLFIVEHDGSTAKDRREFGFGIEDIEMMWNDAFECEEVVGAS